MCYNPKSRESLVGPMLAKRSFRGFSFLRVKMYVYFIRENREGGRVKIGVARSPENRLRQLQTGNSCELEIIYLIECLDAHSIESTLHTMFEPYRVMGEWFEFVPAIKVFISSGFVPNFGNVEKPGRVTVIKQEQAYTEDEQEEWRLETKEYTRKDGKKSLYYNYRRRQGLFDEDGKRLSPYKSGGRLVIDPNIPPEEDDGEWKFEIKRKRRDADRKNEGSTAGDDYYYWVVRTHPTKGTMYYGTLDILDRKNPERFKGYEV